MKLHNVRIAASLVLLAMILVLPSLVLQNGQVAAQPVSTPTATTESPDPDGLEQPVAPDHNPFPDAPWRAEEAQAIIDALLRGEYLQTDQLEPTSLIDVAQLQAAPAAGLTVFLPRVARGPNQVVPPSPTPTRTRTPDDDDDDDDVSGADVGVGIWPNPGVQVVRGGSVAYEIRASNFGKGPATNVRVKLPYNKNQIEIYGSDIPNRGDWVSEVTDNQVTFTFSKIDNGQQRKATLFFRVKSNLGNGTTVSMRANYEWNDADDGGSGSTNQAPVRVGDRNEGSAWALFTVSPSTVKPNESQRFSTDRYAPSEGIVFWLNLPDGSTRALNETAVADSQGRLTVDFRFKDLPPGNFSLVGQGRRSGTIVVGFFTVK